MQTAGTGAMQNTQHARIESCTQIVLPHFTHGRHLKTLDVKKPTKPNTQVYFQNEIQDGHLSK